MSTIILTHPLGNGSSSIPGTIVTNIIIPNITSAPDNAVIVDSVPSMHNVSVKWIYTIMDETSNQVLTAEVLANHRFGSTPTHTRYGLVGDSIPHQVDVGLFIPDEIGIKITNLHTGDLKVNIIRLQMLS